MAGKYALVCYSYSIEVSPFLTNLCSYLYENENVRTDIYLDTLVRHKSFTLDGANLFILKFPYFEKLLNRKIDFKKKYFVFLLNVFLSFKRYSHIFVVDYLALDILRKTNYPLRKVTYISFEGTDYMHGFEKSMIKRSLTKCHSQIIASSERAERINAYLQSNIQFYLFPISIRPKRVIKHNESATLKMIFSGYFAEWSAIEELIFLFRHGNYKSAASLLIQGHAMGTKDYYTRIKQLAENQENIAVDSGYYTENEHYEMLSNNDIGIAFYKNLTGTDNFENLIYSSGKIASYLWAGLAVMTNIDCPLTHRRPFLFVREFSMVDFTESCNKYQNNRNSFKESAFRLANEKYNFDTYMADFMNENLKLNRTK